MSISPQACIISNAQAILYIKSFLSNGQCSVSKLWRITQAAETSCIAIKIRVGKVLANYTRIPLLVHRTMMTLYIIKLFLTSRGIFDGRQG